MVIARLSACAAFLLYLRQLGTTSRDKNESVLRFRFPSENEETHPDGEGRLLVLGTRKHADLIGAIAAHSSPPASLENKKETSLYTVEYDT